MGVMDVFRKKSKRPQCGGLVSESFGEVETRPDNYVPGLSMYELQNTDWARFAGVLKNNGVLSASYDKTPVAIDYSIASDESLKVELTFQSKTSDSVRRVEICGDRAYLYVNGAIEMYPESQRNKDLNKLWKSFQAEIRYRSMIDTNRKASTHRYRGKRLMRDAMKMIEMGNLYDREQEFLKKYKDAEFDGFMYYPLFEKSNNSGYYVDYVCEMPKFVPLEQTQDGKYRDGEPVLPFSPKTLEHCILHMTNGQMIEDGEDLANFEKKCRQIQNYSCFESEDWDKVIEFGKNVVKNKYIVAVMTHDEGM